MWIKMKQNYAGPLGSFYKGEKKDLSESKIKQFTKSRIKFEKTCAPWDEQRDDKAITLAAAADDLTAASKAASAADTEAEILCKNAIELTKTAEASLLAAQKAGEALEKYKGRSNKTLKLESKRADLICDRDSAAAAMADAIFGLAKMIAEDAKLNYEKAKAKHEKLIVAKKQ